MSSLTILKKSTYFLILLALFVQCESDSCNNEPPKATVESNSAGRSNRVWVTFNHQPSGRSFQLQDITEDNPKTTGPLPKGEYSIHATVSKSTGTQTIRLNATLKDCIDYKVFVNAISVSMYLNGEAR